MSAELIDGNWTFTGFDVIPVDRPVTARLYKFQGTRLHPYSVIEDQPYNRHGNRYEGRVVVDALAAEGKVPDEYYTHVGPTDVLQFPLYHGGPHPFTRGAGTCAKLPNYRSNLAAMNDIAPQVEGIILGNCGAELAYHHLIQFGEAGQEYRDYANRLAVEFVKETGDLVREAGGRPFWGPMDRDILMDCYECDWRMGRAVQEAGGVMIVFAEDAIFPKWCCIYGAPAYDGDPAYFASTGDEFSDPNEHAREYVPGGGDECGSFVSWERREPYPYRTFIDYCREFEVWFCIGYDWHFKRGYDKLLQLHGIETVIY